MASFKLNMARIRGCPAAKQAAAAMEKYGLPDGDEFGVLQQSSSEQAVFGTIIRRTQQAIPQIDGETKEVSATAVEKVTTYSFAVKPAMEHIELYSGSSAAIEQVGLFLTSCLGFAAVIEPIEVDVPAAVELLAKETQRFQLKAVRVSDYSHNSYMTGTYAPKFLDSQHGMEFLAEYAQQVMSASVRFAAKAGKVNVTLTPNACFGYSCHEDDQAAVQALLRKLAK